MDVKNMTTVLARNLTGLLYLEVGDKVVLYRGVIVAHLSFSWMNNQWWKDDLRLELEQEVSKMSLSKKMFSQYFHEEHSLLLRLKRVNTKLTDKNDGERSKKLLKKKASIGLKLFMNQYRSTNALYELRGIQWNDDKFTTWQMSLTQEFQEFYAAIFQDFLSSVSFLAQLNWKNSCVMAVLMEFLTLDAFYHRLVYENSPSTSVHLTSRQRKTRNIISVKHNPRLTAFALAYADTLLTEK